MNKTIDELKKAFTVSGMTYEKLSESSGVPSQTIKNIMTGRTSDPRMQTVQMLESVLEPYLSKDDTEKAEPDPRLISIYENQISYQQKWIRFLSALSVLCFITIIILSIIFIEV